MAFHGLFVGIDRYHSPRISNLTCASRDAQALHALFADTFGQENAVLLINKEATSVAVRRQFEERLWRTVPEDVVVLAFSGHGADTHQLVTYDADPDNFEVTTIHLDELTRLFARIPARNVVLLLDCCFAGGAGAKVFHHDIAKKAPASTEEILTHVSGTGRVILTASRPDQEAIEDRRLGHGLFTYHLLEGLRGAPEIVTAGRIPVLMLAEFVTRRVIAAAAQRRHTQEPGLRGTVDGDVSFPVLTPGTFYKRVFPDRVQARVTSDVTSLTPYRFHSELLRIWQGAISGLNDLQQAAINKFGLFDGTNLVVSAPTSSGKTMIGELAALYAFLRKERAYFLLPLRALVNDKYDEFTRKYGEYGIRVIRSTGEIEDDNDSLLHGKFDMALLTYEKFTALTLVAPHILRQAGLVVIDEVQMITDRNRGGNLEFFMTLLKMQRRLGVEPQVIALSAVVGDTNGMEGWLAARLLRSDRRPVPLEEGIIGMDGTFRYLADDGREETAVRFVTPEYRKGSSQDIIVPLVRKLVADGEKVIVFRETKPIVQATARYLREALGLPPANSAIAALPSGDPSQASILLRECLSGGVAFHNADLDREERRVIEEAFRDPMSGLQVLTATTTLAMGVNTPAWSVVIAGLEHPDGPYSVAEYKNMVGRAGRLGFTPKGKSFLVATSRAEEDQLWRNYVSAHPEDVVSRFQDTNILSLICRVLATAAASRTPEMTEEELVGFIENSFGAYQTQRRTGQQLWEPNVIRDALQRLVRHELVSCEQGRFRLTQLGRVAGEAGVEVESILRLVDALRGVPLQELSPVVLIAAVQSTLELDNVFFPVHKRSVQERSRWQGMMHQQGIPSAVVSVLQSTATDNAHYTIRCKRTAAALMWIDGTELRGIEASVLQHLPGDNAAGPIRAVAERTRDLIPAAGRVAELLNRDEGLLTGLIDSLLVRLELGVPVSVVPLARIARRGLERGDYLSLVRANLFSSDAIRLATDDVLLKIMGNPKKVAILRAAVSSISKPVETEALPADPLPMSKVPAERI
jgi:replicative superfamily II helicase